jgi:hypothetical protein
VIEACFNVQIVVFYGLMRLTATLVYFCPVDMKKSKEPAKIPILLLGYVNMPNFELTQILPKSFYTEYKFLILLLSVQSWFRHSIL